MRVTARINIYMLVEAGYEQFPKPEFDQPHDECGIVVVVSPNFNAGRIAASGISELENRGHEMVGMVTDGGGTLPITTDFGTGKDLFPDGGYAYNFANPSRRAMAHARYSTQGTQDLSGAQPHAVRKLINDEWHAIAHVENGNLTNTHALARSQRIAEEDLTTDNDLMAHTFMSELEEMVLEHPDRPVDTKALMKRTIPKFEGAFTSAVMLRDDIVVYTDHHGFKPAMIGQLPDGGTMVASERTALEAAEATFLREMNPGEMVIIHSDGTWDAEQWAEPEPKRCILEILYVMRPETAQGTPTSFGGVAIKEARYNAGRAVAEVTPIRRDRSDLPIDTDFGFGIPNSGIPVGEGYCEEKNLLNNDRALMARRNQKDEKIETRSFIAPTQKKRQQIVGEKLIADPEELTDKKVEGGDDTLIRGTVTKKIADMLREAGAAEVHMRVGAPMILYTCELGIDLGDPDELLAARSAAKLGIDISGGYDSLTAVQIRSMVQEMCDYTGVDSLAFLTPHLLRERVLGERAGEFCMKCMTGEMPDLKPVPVTINLSAHRQQPAPVVV